MARLPEAQNTRNVLLLTGAGHFGTHFFELMFPTLAVSIASQVGLPLEQVLGWGFLAYLAFGLGALPAGLLADRLGARLPLIVALFGLGVAALAASEAPNGRVLSLCLAVMGACASVYHPAGLTLISRTFDPRGRALGVNGLFGSAAIVCTPLVTATLADHLGWQQTFRAVGYAMCALAVACAFLHVDERRAATVPAARLPGLPRRREALLPFAVLLVAATSAAVVYRGAMLVQPGYFAARTSAIGFGAATSLAYGFGIAGQYVGGLLADRSDVRRLYLAFHVVSLPALLLMTALSGLPLIGGAAVFVFFNFGVQPIEHGLFARYTPPRWRGTAYGAKLTLTVGVGAFAVWLVGWASAADGLSYALVCLAGVSAVVITAAAVLSSLRREASQVVVPSAPHDLLPGRRS